MSKRISLTLAFVSLLASAAAAEAAATTTIYVSATAAADGNGTQARPFRTITAALDRARCIRYGCGPGAQGSILPIAIRVLPGTYPVSWQPDRVAADPTLERGPILMNVSGTTLAGSTVIADDGSGYPSEFAVPGTETEIRPADGEEPAADLDRLRALMLIHATHDARGRAQRGDGAVVRGFVFDGRNDSEDQVDEAIAVRLVQGYAITGNLFHTIGFIGAQTGPSIGAITGNSAVDSSCLGVGVNGGSKSAPQHTVVTNNSFMRNFCGGIIVLGDSVMLEGYDIGAQAGLFTLDALPNETLTSVATEIIGNRLSNNDVPGGDSFDGFGVRIGIFSGVFGMNPAQTFTQVNVLMKSNEVRDNLVGILVNSAFLSRDFDQTFSARVNATFIDNDVCGNETAPAIFDFTGVGADPASVKYLQNSTYWITYSGHDLDGFGYNNPASDPYLLPAVTPLNNTLRVNGVSLHGTSAPTPRPCANDSARH